MDAGSSDAGSADAGATDAGPAHAGGPTGCTSTLAFEMEYLNLDTGTTETVSGIGVPTDPNWDLSIACEDFLAQRTSFCFETGVVVGVYTRKFIRGRV